MFFKEIWKNKDTQNFLKVQFSRFYKFFWHFTILAPGGFEPGTTKMQKWMLNHSAKMAHFCDKRWTLFFPLSPAVPTINQNNIPKKPWFFAFLSYLLIYRSCRRVIGLVGLLEGCTFRIKKIPSLKVSENKKFRRFLPKIDNFLKNSHLLTGCIEWANFLHTTIFDSEESESERVFGRKNFSLCLWNGSLWA